MFVPTVFILLDSTVDLLCILETMFQVFGIVERIHVGGDRVDGGHRANGPGPDGRSVDQLFGKRLDPWQKDILFMRTKVLGHLESKEKGIRCEQSVQNRRISRALARTTEQQQQNNLPRLPPGGAFSTNSCTASGRHTS